MNQYIVPYRLFLGSFLPNWLLRRTEISPGAKLCYGRLAQYAHKKTGVAFPARDTLADEIGVTSRQADRYIKELKAQRLIEVVRQGKTEVNLYRFLFHSWMQSDSTDMSTHPQSDSTDMSSGESTYMSTKENHLKRINKNTSSRKREVEPTAFSSFYKEYPRKRGRTAALKAWLKLKPDDSLAQRIIADVGSRVASDPDWQKDGGQFVPYPATYLNGRRWEDEWKSGNGVSDGRPEPREAPRGDLKYG